MAEENKGVVNPDVVNPDVVNPGVVNVDNRVRIGVIGAGWFASRRHIPDAMGDSNVVVTALCRRNPEELSKMCAHFGLTEAQGYSDWKEMLSSAPLDAVLIATPHAQHYEQARQALECGFHVLIEKPMAIRGEDARELVRIAAERGLKLAVAVNPPFWAHCHRAKRSVQSEKMGEFEAASMFWTGSAGFLFGKEPRPSNLPGVVEPTMYRSDPDLNGGGYFIDGGSHLVSEMIWITGKRVSRVTALMDSLPTDMRTVVSLEFENGAIGSITSIGDSGFATRRVRNFFACSNGTVQINSFEFETTISVLGQEPMRFRESDLASVASPVSNFVAAIQGRSALFSPGEHGAHVVEVVEAAYESAATGQTITIPVAHDKPSTEPIVTSVSH